MAGGALAGAVLLAGGSRSLGLEAAAVAKRKINIAGRQRMLTQRMAKAACFSHLGIETAMHQQMMADAHALFSKSLKGLRYGDPDLGLTRETSRTVNTGLTKVERLWASYGAAVEACIEAGSVDRASLDVIVAENLGILAEMNRTVGLTEREYGGGDIPLHLAVAINIAGRQRMFTQKMTKELGMIRAGYDPDATRKAMAGTVDLFDRSLIALREGMPMVGIQPPKTEPVKAQLGVVAGLWQPVRPELANIADGGAIADDFLDFMAAENNTLLVEMNKAVFLYEDET
jgi:hypothetical protein